MKVCVGTTFPEGGDFCWHPDEENPTRIVLSLPGGIGIVRLKVQRGPDPGEVPDGPKWGWDGDIEKPTLTPSINSTSGPVNWHGFLKDGVAEGKMTYSKEIHDGCRD